MRFTSIGEGRAVVELWPSDLAALTTVCQKLALGDVDEKTHTTIEAMEAAFEAAQLALWVQSETVDGAPACTLDALRAGGNCLFAAVELAEA